MNMSNYLISIIVPVYNVESYLDKCIQSICNQQYYNLEIILIDDGSTDTSGLICEKWKKIDNRIVVIHKDNGGLSSARNCGLDICSGSYIGFVDSDDFLDSDMYPLLAELIEQNNADISTCRIKKINERGQRLDDAVTDELHVYSHDEAIKLLLDDNIITSHACNKLFKKALWTDTRFPVGDVYEDIAIMHEVFNKANVIACSSSEKYNYLIRSGSTSFRTDTKRDYGLFKAFYKRFMFVCEYIPQEILIQKCLKKAVIEGNGAVFRMNCYRKNGYKEAIKEIKTFYKNNMPYIISSNFLNGKQKMKAISIAYVFPIYDLACKIYRKAKQR